MKFFQIKGKGGDFQGFSLVELLALVCIFGILAAIAIPGFSAWLPDYRLRSAARDLYSNMQMTRIGAIKSGADWAIVFQSDGYLVCSDAGDGDWTTTGDNTIEKTVVLSDYGSGVAYGHGSASSPMGSSFDDEITFSSNVAVFDSRGRLASSSGYVYLA
ncbi:MAG: hypothetical protein JRJ29_17740, partial [Deltaproteobacteria bacterium]|nr:hypothetical protein [Deltaproteobacteria bacterium]